MRESLFAKVSPTARLLVSRFEGAQKRLQATRSTDATMRDKSERLRGMYTEETTKKASEATTFAVSPTSAPTSLTRPTCSIIHYSSSPSSSSFSTSAFLPPAGAAFFLFFAPPPAPLPASPFFFTAFGFNLSSLHLSLPS